LVAPAARPVPGVRSLGQKEFIDDQLLDAQADSILPADTVAP